MILKYRAPLDPDLVFVLFMIQQFDEGVCNVEFPPFAPSVQAIIADGGLISHLKKSIQPD